MKLLVVSVLALIVSGKSFACQEAQVTALIKDLKLVSSICIAQIESPSYFRSSGVCPMSEVDLVNRDIHLSLAQCQDANDSGYITGVAVLNDDDIFVVE